MNLLEETLEGIAESKHTIEDIAFIGSTVSGYSCTWDQFALLANREYDSSYGSQKVATDLKIIFKDGVYMKRAEYDGSEWWQFQVPQTIPTDTKQITCLFASHSCGWESLAEIHKGD